MLRARVGPTSQIYSDSQFLSTNDPGRAAIVHSILICLCIRDRSFEQSLDDQIIVNALSKSGSSAHGAADAGNCLSRSSLHSCAQHRYEIPAILPAAKASVSANQSKRRTRSSQMRCQFSNRGARQLSRMYFSCWFMLDYG